MVQVTPAWALPTQQVELVVNLKVTLSPAMRSYELQTMTQTFFASRFVKDLLVSVSSGLCWLVSLLSNGVWGRRCELHL